MVKKTRRLPMTNGAELGVGIRLAHEILLRAGIDKSPSWVSHRVRKYLRERQLNDFLDFLSSGVQLSPTQKAGIQADPDYAGLIEILMMPGNYAGRTDDEKRRGRELDALVHEADCLRERFAQLTRNPYLGNVGEARRVITRYQHIRETLADAHRIIPAIESVTT